MVKTKELEFIPPKKRKEPKTKDPSKANNGTSHINVDHITKIQGKSKDGLKSSLIQKKWNSAEIIDAPTVFNNKLNPDNHTESEENELNLYENISQKPLRSSTVTPNSYASEESSFDGIVKSTKSQELLTSEKGSTKKRVNIRTDLDIDCDDKERNSPSVSHKYQDLESGETSILNPDENSLDRFNTHKSTDNYLTMTGTIKRGKKLGQEFNVQLNISRDELEKINQFAVKKSEEQKQDGCCVCKLGVGLHIFLLSLICFPFVLIINSVYSFYIGTLTWYNLFTFFSQEKTIFHRIFITPFLIVAYPITILLFTIGLGIYGGFKQISLRFHVWFNEICDLEKGFYGWLCGVLRLSDCSPYEVVILTDIREDPTIRHSSTEELSL
uniref:CSON012006 protein n=1 Tax=Culicoides sonorensis TaxID=179676 RepID=A0A336K4B7_CULSO